MIDVGFIGFSEAGPAFADGLVRNGARVVAFDLRSLDPATVAAQRARTKRVGARLAMSMAEVCEGTGIVMSTVTAGAALAVAKEAAAHLRSGQFYCDINSVSPDTKLAIRDAIAPSRARYVEAVAMGRVAEGRLPPLLFSGPDAADLISELTGYGLSLTLAGTDWGQAPAAKLLRSVVVKGVEAILSEAFEAAAKRDATDALISTLTDWLPGVDWPTFVDYHLTRVAQHGLRRADELRECAAFLETLDVAASTTRGAAERQALAAAKPEL